MSKTIGHVKVGNGSIDVAHGIRETGGATQVGTKDFWNPMGRRDRFGMPVGAGTMSPGDIWGNLRSSLMRDYGSLTGASDQPPPPAVQPPLGAPQPINRPSVLPSMQSYPGTYNAMAAGLVGGQPNPNRFVPPLFQQQMSPQQFPQQMSPYQTSARPTAQYGGGTYSGSNFNWGAY